MEPRLEDTILNLSAMRQLVGCDDTSYNEVDFAHDRKTLDIAVDVLSALHRQGIDTRDQAIALIGKSVPAAPFHKDGVWHCPTCNSRAKVWHSYCHQCGQRMNWGRFKK